MVTSRSNPIRFNAALATVAGALLLAACASPQLDAQWTDPSAKAMSLRGVKVLVACSAYEDVLQRICVDQVSAEVVARGATPVAAPTLMGDAPGAPASNEAYANAAREAGAAAVLATAVTSVVSTSGSSGVSIGIGGFGFGGGGFGGGVGVSAPIGGTTRTEAGHWANSKLIDAANGRLMWTAKATTPSSSDVNAQLGTLAKTLMDSAEKSGFF
jgi:hypothetical protein